MKIHPKHEWLANKMGEGYYYIPGSQREFFHLWKDGQNQWRCTSTWTLECDKDEEFVVLDSISRKAIKMNCHHFEAIERADDATEQVTKPLGYCEVSKEDYVQLVDDDCAVSVIFENLIMARTVSDAETTVGYVRDANTGDIFKVTIDYLGNNPDEKD
jgi:hypothetical protein